MRTSLSFHTLLFIFFALQIGLLFYLGLYSELSHGDINSGGITNVETFDFRHCFRIDYDYLGMH